MKDSTQLDVLICGAGAAGLTLALDLARRGVSFRLIDKISQPFGGSRGKGIQPRTLEVFEDLGIVNRIASVGGPYPAERHYGEDGSFSATEEASEVVTQSPTEPYNKPLMVPQFLTERVLRDRLAELGHAPEYGVELTDIQQDAHGVSTVLVRDGVGASVRFSYLAACDGGRSFVRRNLGIEFRGRTLGVRAIVADVTLSGLDRTVWHRFNEASMERHVSLCPLAGTPLFQIQAPIPLEGDVDLSAEGLNAMIQSRTGKSHIQVESVHWSSAYSMNARLADRYRVGRIFLAGDAAHTHPPTGGQGLNTSVQDAYNLGWKLAAVLAGAPEAVLDSYEQERRPIAAGMLGMSTKLLEAAKKGDLRRGRETQQLDLCYDESVLVQSDAGSSSSMILSGSRAPDALLLGQAGMPVRLFELFKGPHWTLLAYGVARGSLPTWSGVNLHTIGEDAELLDSTGALADSYGVSRGDLVLIRPDGYIGATGRLDEVHVISDYLANFAETMTMPCRDGQGI